MNESESDIKFKVYDNIIPAHKKVLTQRSQHFANLFNDPSTPKVIEINSRKDKPLPSE